MKSGLSISAVALLSMDFLVGPASSDTWDDIKKGATEAGRAIEKGARDAGEAIGEGLQETGEAIEEGAQDTGAALEEAMRDAGRGINHVGTELNRELCDFFASGDSGTDRAECNVDGAAGYDTEEGTYTYDPSAPDERYFGNETGEPKSENERELRNLAQYLNDSQIQTWEYQDNDVLGIKRFVQPDTPLGEAWPNASAEVRPPTRSGEVRSCCTAGGGRFLALRNDHGKLRFHSGTDFVTTAGEPILAPVTGVIERVASLGRVGLNRMSILGSEGYAATVYFVEPTAEMRSALEKGHSVPVVAGQTVIGHAQKLQPAYPENVPQHVHLTLTDPKGNFIRPDGQAEMTRTPPVKNMTVGEK